MSAPSNDLMALLRSDGSFEEGALAMATSQRRRRLLEAAHEAGFQAVVVYSSAAHSLLGTDGVWWATGYKPMAESAVAFASPEDFELFLTPTWDEARAQGVVGDRAQGVGEIFSALQSWLARNALSGVEVLVCGVDALPARRYARASEVFTAIDGAGTTVLLETSRHHDDYEIALATRAAAIAEEGFSQLLEHLRPGLGEFEAVALLDGLLRELGSEDNFVLVAASQLNRSVHPPSERIIAQGDVLLAEISPSVGGVFTQICRSVSIGTPGPRLREDFELLDRAFGAGLEACVPGRPVSGAALAMDGVLTEGGFGDYCRPPFMRARGHGLGIGSVLPGDVNKNSGLTFCKGDYFVLHPNQFLPTSGYLLCGEPLVLEDHGARELSSRRGTLAVLEVD